MTFQPRPPAASGMGTEVSPYQVFVLHEGFSEMIKNGMKANCTCTLIKGQKNLIVDTMTPWDKNKVLTSLKTHNIEVGNIDFVISTHGHSDHCGNNNLFLNATHIMGFCISNQDHYTTHPFTENQSLLIDDFVTVIPTPGHTLAHVSVVVKTASQGTVVVAGDLFENEHDILDDSIWKAAGSESVLKQIESRNKVLSIADWIIPGHGKMFKVHQV